MLLPLAALLAAVPTFAQDTPPPPPRGHPPGFFKAEPRFEPGPFVVFFDAGEKEVSQGAEIVLDNAVKYWPEPHRPRFVLCYDPAEEGEAGAGLEEARKATIVAELTRRGAVQVLDSVWDCYHSERPLPDSRARMAMLGVLAMPESAEQIE
jgi:hypothetical protein